MSEKVYRKITDEIIKKLEEGVVPWRKPWGDNGDGLGPRNLVSKRAYRGINTLLLSCQGWSSPWWMTYKQAKDGGGNVRKGERGVPIVFWKWLEKESTDDAGETNVRRFPLLRYFTVFNGEQCDGVETPFCEPQNDFNPIERCERVQETMPNAPQIVHREPRAYYRPNDDLVNMPRPTLFESPEEYYSTLFHELTHSTGHSSRLDRSGIRAVSAFGSHEYSKEELVAEMGAAFLCGRTRISPITIDGSASYIQHWVDALKEDHRMVVRAGAAAQKAVDYITDEQTEAS
jgi:antirestriction protein ArdC